MESSKPFPSYFETKPLKHSSHFCKSTSITATHCGDGRLTSPQRSVTRELPWESGPRCPARSYRAPPSPGFVGRPAQTPAQARGAARGSPLLWKLRRPWGATPRDDTLRRPRRPPASTRTPFAARGRGHQRRPARAAGSSGASRGNGPGNGRLQAAPQPPAHRLSPTDPTGPHRPPQPLAEAPPLTGRRFGAAEHSQHQAKESGEHWPHSTGHGHGRSRRHWHGAEGSARPPMAPTDRKSVV